MNKKSSAKRNVAGNRKRRLELSVFFLTCLFLLYACSSEPNNSPEMQPTVANAPTETKSDDAYDAELTNTMGDLSKFQHGSDQHTRLPCLLCHEREDNSASVKFPGKVTHLPCASCHVDQFSDQSSQMCTICHTDSQTGAMKNFPGLKSFGVRFSHARHTSSNCATCHQPQGRGVALSIPSGRAAHQTCFQCHTADSASSMSSCNVCHEPGRLVRTSEWAGAFGKSFSHAKHSAKNNLNCATCHTVRSGFARGKQVSAPQGLMHFPSRNRQSCASCHNGKRAFGSEEFISCKRCHNPKTFKF